MSQKVQAQVGIGIRGGLLLGGGHRPPEDGAHAGQEGPPGNGLDQVLVGSQVQPAYDVLFATQGSEDKDMAVGQFPYPGYQLKAVHPGHAQVGDREGGPVLEEQPQGLPAVGCGEDLVTILLQPVPQQGQQVGFVVHKEHFRRRHGSVLHLSDVRCIPMYNFPHTFDNIVRTHLPQMVLSQPRLRRLAE